MATILLAWELGAGTGHAMHAAPIVNALAHRGHRVLAALRDPSVAGGLFAPSITVVPGACRCERFAPKRLTNTFADLLADAASFDDSDTLASVAGAWRNLLRLLNPDLVLFDHAPTVLLASRGLECRRIVFGPGFNCPPDVFPLPSLRPWANLDPEQLKGTEAPLLDCANRVLESWGEPPMDRLGQLYGDADDTLLITFPELDCYREHRTDGASYFGPVLGRGGGVAPQWPAGEGPKVYAYLRAFQHLPVLMKLLGERDLPTLIYAPSPGLAEQLRRDFARPTLRIETRPLDLSLVAEACDVAISHAGHGMVCSLLLNGLPALHVPLHPEMGLNARAVRLLGAGLDAPADDPAKLAERFGTIVGAPGRYRHAALRFAARHADFDAAGQQDAMLARIEETLAAASVAR
jgi:hypothetical protein